VVFRPQRRLTFNIDDLKFRDLAKQWFLKLIYDKIELQKYSYNVILVTSSPLRHQNNFTKFFPIWVSPNKNFWLCQ